MVRFFSFFYYLLLLLIVVQLVPHATSHTTNTTAAMKLHFSPSLTSSTPAFTPRPHLWPHVPTTDADLKTLLAWLMTDDDNPAPTAADIDSFAYWNGADEDEDAPERLYCLPCTIPTPSPATNPNPDKAQCFHASTDNASTNTETDAENSTPFAAMNQHDNDFEDEYLGALDNTNSFGPWEIAPHHINPLSKHNDIDDDTDLENDDDDTHDDADTPSFFLLG
jgi:hypothetical protein